MASSVNPIIVLFDDYSDRLASLPHSFTKYNAVIILLDWKLKLNAVGCFFNEVEGNKKHSVNGNEVRVSVGEL